MSTYTESKPKHLFSWLLFRNSHFSIRSTARSLAPESELFSCRQHQESRLPWTDQNREKSTEPTSPWAPLSINSSHYKGGDKEEVFTTRPFTEHSQGHFLRQQLSLAKKILGKWEWSPRSFQPEVTKKDSIMKPPFALSFSEPLQMVFPP